MKIGILQTGHLPDEIRQTHGDYDALFRRLLAGHGFEFETFCVVDMEFPDGPEAADGWLITGSRHGAYEDHPWIAPLEELIRAIRDAGRPLIGVCFGHQIIAQALGGKVVKFPGGWSVGRTGYSWHGAPAALNAWHQDQIVELPRDAEVIASNDFCAFAGLRYGKDIWTIQAHPEFDAQIIDGLMTYRAPGVVPDDLTAAARAQLDRPTANARIAAEMAAFLKGKTRT